MARRTAATATGGLRARTSNTPHTTAIARARRNGHTAAATAASNAATAGSRTRTRISDGTRHTARTSR